MNVIDERMDELTAHVQRMSPIHENSDEEKSYVSSTDRVDSASTVSGIDDGLDGSLTDDDEHRQNVAPSSRQELNQSFATPDRQQRRRSMPFNTHMRSPRKKLLFEQPQHLRMSDDEDEEEEEENGDADEDESTMTSVRSARRTRLAEMRMSEVATIDEGFSYRSDILNDSFVSSVGFSANNNSNACERTNILGSSVVRNCSISPISSPARRMHALVLCDNEPCSPESIFKRSLRRSRNNSSTSVLSKRLADEFGGAGSAVKLMPPASESAVRHLMPLKLKQIIDDSAYDTCGELSPSTSGRASVLEGSSVEHRRKRDFDSSFERQQQYLTGMLPSSGPCDHASKKRAACSGISRIESDFEYKDTLGRGEFGVVLLCRNRLDGQLYAIKKLQRPRRGSVDEKRALMEVWAHAWPGSCKHLVRYYSAWVESEFMYVQNEYCNGGSLEALLRQYRDSGRRLQEADLVQILLQVAAALHDMHRRKMAHLDVKPANIFLCKVERSDDLDAGEESLPGKSTVDEGNSMCTAGVTYKLGDLGRVMSFRDSPALDASSEAAQKNDAGCIVVIDEGDSRYMAPELLHWRNSSIHKADIFSLGLSVYEAGGYGPLPACGDEWQAVREHPDSLRLPQCSAAFNTLLQSLIAADPAKRPSASDILKHPTLIPEKTPDELKRELNAARFDNHILSKQLEEYEKLANFYHCNNFSSTAMFGSTAPVCWATPLLPSPNTKQTADATQNAVSTAAASPIIHTFYPPQHQHYMCRPRLMAPAAQQLNERHALRLMTANNAPAGVLSMQSPDADVENRSLFVNGNLPPPVRPFLKVRKPSSKTLYHASSCTY